MLQDRRISDIDRREAEERTKIMLDTTPLCCNFWDDQFRNVDCNQEAAKLFDLPSKQDYLDRFNELSPEYQPNGELSSQKALRHITAAFENGREVFEWMHQKLDGTPIPAEITLIRVKWRRGHIVAGYTRDLRDLKASEAQRRETEERMQIMLDTTPLCCNFWDDQFQNIDCNQEAVNLFDLSSKQEYLDRFFELSPEIQPNGKPTSEEALRHITVAYKDGREVFEWMHQKPDGTPIPAEITLIRVKWRGGYIVVGYTRDLRELKASEAERREAEERTQIMLDATPLCCNFWDEQFQNVDCNQEAVNLFGLTDKQEYLDRFFELSPEFQPSGRPSSEEALGHITAAFQNGREVFEWMHQKLDGTPIPAEISLVRVKRGEKYIVAGYTRDLRELKATMIERDRERSLLQQVMDSSPVCFAIFVDGVVQFVSPYFKDFFGIDVNEKLASYFERPEDRNIMLDELKRYGAVNWKQTPFVTKSGEHKDMLANLFYTDYYGQQAIMLWLIDVTDMRKVESELRLARDAAEESAKAKSEFLANMSHEIRTPMNAILGMTNLILRTNVDEKQHDYLLKTKQSANSLLRIINDILDFSKIEAGKLDIEEVEFSLASVIGGVMDVIAPHTGEVDLQIRTQVDDGVQKQLTGDPLRLNQVLMNLMSNAIKFTPGGQITLGVKEASRQADRVTLEFIVADTGIGMSQDQVKNLFTPFTQADTSTTRKYGGTGLGLAISRSLVNLMGGTIWCESEPSKGTTFSFTAEFGIPAAANLPDRTTPDEVPERQPQVGMGKRVLLAEDNEINQIVAEELLHIEGFEVDIAGNGREAILKLLSGNYDVILMDIQMPEMDGISATAEIRKMQQYQEIPIIAMTAHAMSGDREKSLQAGMNDHLTKPIDPETMYRTIMRWLR